MKLSLKRSVVSGGRLSSKDFEKPFKKIAANEQGLLLWRHSMLVQPRTAARFYFVDEDKN